MVCIGSSTFPGDPRFPASPPPLGAEGDVIVDVQKRNDWALCARGDFLRSCWRVIFPVRVLHQRHYSL